MEACRRSDDDFTESEMAELKETAHIDMAPDDLWQKIGSFDAVGKWHPMLAKVGALRHVEGKDGSKQVERLEAFDPTARSYRYAIEETAMPVDNYTAQFHVDAEEKGGSTVMWSARFNVSSVRLRDAPGSGVVVVAVTATG
jgi:mxaD protein